MARLTIRLAVLAALLAGGARARAGEPLPEVPAAVVDEVVEAFRAGDGARLKKVAERDAPDPWFVADQLLARGEKEAAAAFARAAPRPSVARLAVYVEDRWDAPDDGAARAALRASEALLRDGKSADALAATEPGRPFGDDLASVRLLYVRAVALHDLGRDVEAHASLAEGADHAERMGAVLLQSNVLGKSGEWSFEAGDLRSARARFERVLALRAGVGSTRGVVGTHNLLAMTLVGLGENEGARAAAEAALRGAEGSGGRPREVAAALGILGTVSQALSDYAGAVSYGERSLKIAQEAGDRGAEATTLGNLGSAELAMGSLIRAQEYAKRSLRIFQEFGDRNNEARALVNLAAIERRLGRFGRALDFCERALRLFTDLKDDEGLAGALLETAWAYRASGDLARAETLFQRGLTMAQAGGSRPWVSMVLLELGEIAAQRGDRTKAREYFDRARRTNVDLGNKEGVASALTSLGTLAVEEGRQKEGLELLQQAMGYAEESGSTAGLVSCLVALGDAYRQAGQKVEAYAALEKAVRLAERGRLRSSAASALGMLAAAQLLVGEPALAAATARRGIALVNDMVKAQADDRGASTRARYSDIYDVGVEASVETGNVADVCYFLESGRAGSLIEALDNRESLLETGLSPALAQELIKARAEDLRTQAAYRRALAGQKRDEIQSRAKEVDAAEQALARVRARIQDEVKSSAEVFYPEPAPIEEIQALLGEGEALVLYSLGPALDRAIALVIDREGGRVVRLGPSRKISQACEALTAGDAEKDPSATLAALRSLVVTPLGLPASTKRVLVSPDGDLSYAPPALLFASGDALREVACVPSGTAYSSLRSLRDAPGERVLALGDPDYDAASDAQGDLDAQVLLRGGRKLQRLPATREEALAVGDVVLLGADASVDRLRGALATAKRWRAVHLACHGLTRADHGMLSSLALTPSASDSGFLTAADVFSTLRVPTDLVVLSACETSLGQLVRTEGVYGLTRAFLFAGAPRVIVSLWKVEDKATQALMTEFYKRWKSGTPTARALREAQEHVRSQERWSHPAYWAGWVLWGLPG